MIEKQVIPTSEQLAYTAIEGIKDKKGQNIKLLDLRNVTNAISDFFIICHGTSNTNVEAIARASEEEIIKAYDEKPMHREGFDNAEWIILDYFNVVVHILQKEWRDYYKIEVLWADAEVMDINTEDEL